MNFRDKVKLTLDNANERNYLLRISKRLERVGQRDRLHRVLSGCDKFPSEFEFELGDLYSLTLCLVIDGVLTSNEGSTDIYTDTRYKVYDITGDIDLEHVVIRLGCGCNVVSGKRHLPKGVKNTNDEKDGDEIRTTKK